MTEWSWNILLLSCNDIIYLDRFNNNNTYDYQHIDFSLSIPTINPISKWGTLFNANYDGYPDNYSFVTYPNENNNYNLIYEFRTMQDPPIQYCKNVSILYPSILFILSFDYYNINTEISFNNGEIFLETSSSSENEYSSE
jgi:hypothetical protein|tara:strand:- start:314 stop:733 length:420 start_codon:yes stop_codon:yes gene_type:complete